MAGSKVDVGGGRVPVPCGMANVLPAILAAILAIIVFFPLFALQAQKGASGNSGEMIAKNILFCVFCVSGPERGKRQF